MGVHDAIDDEGADRGGLRAAVLEVVQRTRARLEVLALLLVPLGDARVQIPAVIVEPRALGDLADAGEVASFELAKPDDDVGDLHAEVVDVVLDLDWRAAKLQRARQRVAERGVAEMADVRRLVRIDRGVLDDCFFRRRRLRLQLGAYALEKECGTVQIEIQVAIRRGDDARDAGDRAEARRQLLRDRARRFPERTRELKRDRDGEIAERTSRWNLDRKSRDVCDAVLRADRTGNRIVHSSLNAQNHVRVACRAR